MTPRTFRWIYAPKGAVELPYCHSPHTNICTAAVSDTNCQRLIDKSHQKSSVISRSSQYFVMTFQSVSYI